MNEFSHAELRLILEGLDVVRERMREDISVNLNLGEEEYNQVVRLQDKIIEALESRCFY